MEDPTLPQPTEKKKDSKSLWFLFSIVLLGLGLRLINLKQQPFWSDEILSLDITTYYRNIHQMLQYLANVEVHPPLYYLMLHFWTAWFGIGTLGVKSLSVIFGLGTIILAYLWGKIIFQSKKVGLIAAFITAILPFQLEMSQEARPYIIFAFFGLVATLCLWQYFRENKKIYLVGYILANIAGIYLHYTYLIVWAPLAIWGLIELIQIKDGRSRQFVYWLGSNAAVLLGFSFWLVPFFFKYLLGTFVIFGLPARVPIYIRTSWFFEGLFDQTFWLTTSNLVSQAQVVIALIAKVLLIGGFIYALGGIQKKDRMQYWWPIYFTLWFAITPAVLFLFTPQSIPYTFIFERHIIFILVPLAALVAWSLSQLTWKPATIILVIFVLSLVPYANDILGNDANWDTNFNLQDIGNFINVNYKDGDLVLTERISERTVLTHYLQDQIPVYGALPVNYYFNQYDDFATRHTIGLIENEYQSRVSPAQAQPTIDKLTKLNKLYHPKRIWMYGFDDQSIFILNYWFTENNWRQVYFDLGSSFRLELYAK